MSKVRIEAEIKNFLSQKHFLLQLSICKHQGKLFCTEKRKLTFAITVWNFQDVNIYLNLLYHKYHWFFELWNYWNSQSIFFSFTQEKKEQEEIDRRKRLEEGAKETENHARNIEAQQFAKLVSQNNWKIHEVTKSIIYKNSLDVWLLEKGEAIQIFVISNRPSQNQNFKLNVIGKICLPQLYRKKYIKMWTISEDLDIKNFRQ